MPSDFPISDMYVFTLRRSERGLVLLHEADHLLRRFGQLELVDIAAGQQIDLGLRAEADRFLYAIDGACEVELLDLRESSPTRGIHVAVALDAGDPQGVLVPFGVACTLRSTKAARVVLLSTHSETHAEDRTPSPDELQRYAAIQ
jgi:hypothetical protein